MLCKFYHITLHMLSLTCCQRLRDLTEGVYSTYGGEDIATFSLNRETLGSVGSSPFLVLPLFSRCDLTRTPSGS